MSVKKLEVHIPSITPEDSQEHVNSSLWSKVERALKNITVEPMVICYVLPTILSSFTSINLALEKACRVNLGFDEGTCNALSDRNQSYPGYRASEESVQSLSANMVIWKNIIRGVVAVILSLFLGSWSDRHKKRKLLMMNPMLGEIICCSALLLSTYFFFELPLEFNMLVESIPHALSGGSISMSMGTYSYISEISSRKSRTSRIGTIQVAVNVSMCVGVALSGVLFYKTGFNGVISTSLTIFLCGYMYGLFFVKDSWEFEVELHDKEKRKKKNFLVDFFDTKHVVDTFRTAFAGERKKRARICWILILTMLLTGPASGENNVAYFYVSSKFGWSAIDASIFTTFQNVTQILGTTFSLALFEKYLQVDDSVLGIISTGSKIVAAFFYAFAPSPIFYYLGALIEVLNTTSIVAIRSIISKLVTEHELGKVNSVYGLVESIVPILYGPLYSIVYAATITIFPGAFYMSGAALTVPAVFIFIWLYIEHCKDDKEAQSQIPEIKINFQQQ